MQVTNGSVSSSQAVSELLQKGSEVVGGVPVRVLQCVAVWCSVLQYCAVCCSSLQDVTVSELLHKGS